MRMRNRRSTTSPSATGAASTPSRPMSATSPRSRTAGADPRGVAAARRGGAFGGRARRRVAVAAEPGAIPDDVGAQGVRRLPPGPLDEGRRSRLLHRVLLGVQPVRFTRSGQLRDCQCAARRPGRATKGARPAGHRRQLRSLGPGWHGLFGGRARQYQCAGPGSAGTLGRAQRARRGRRQRHRAGNRDQGQLATCREGAGQFSSADSRPRVAERRRGGNRRQ